MTILQILSIVAALFTLVGIYSYKVQSSSFTWTQNTATIVDHIVQHDNGGDLTKYFPKVSYRYEVNSKSYTCSTFRLMGNPFFGTEADANVFFKDYPIGESIDIFYDPVRPQRAIIEHVNILGAKIFLGIGITFLLGCGFFWIKKLGWF
ncbi:MAG: DUF3592 domain-containing protein [Fibrobacterales bacterium]